jgi:hypothetical protein
MIIALLCFSGSAFLDVSDDDAESIIDEESKER